MSVVVFIQLRHMASAHDKMWRVLSFLKFFYAQQKYSFFVWTGHTSIGGNGDGTVVRKTVKTPFKILDCAPWCDRNNCKTILLQIICNYAITSTVPNNLSRKQFWTERVIRRNNSFKFSEVLKTHLGMVPEVFKQWIVNKEIHPVIFRMRYTLTFIKTYHIVR